MYVRAALKDDAVGLAQLAVMAGHGVVDLLYEGLVPGQGLIDTIVKRRIHRPGDTAELRRWRCASLPDGTLVGAINAMPYEETMVATPDPLIGSERSDPVAEVGMLEALCTGTYYINILAVFPSHRRHGAGRVLLDDAANRARELGLAALSLCTYESDEKLIAFYQASGFQITESRSVRSHPALGFGGNWVLMTKRV